MKKWKACPFLSVLKVEKRYLEPGFFKSMARIRLRGARTSLQSTKKRLPSRNKKDRVYSGIGVQKVPLPHRAMKAREIKTPSFWRSLRNHKEEAGKPRYLSSTRATFSDEAQYLA